MSQDTDDVSEAQYVPWLDSSLLPEESVYAVINKVAWFVAMPPIKFLQACRVKGGKYRSFDPVRNSYFLNKYNFKHYLTNERLAPLILGHPLSVYLEIVGYEYGEVLYAGWDAQFLRICPVCIAMGVHLKIHQHLAVEKCPMHCVPLQSLCPHCSHPMLDSVQSNQPAFACSQCKKSLLNKGEITTHHSQAFRELVTARVTEFEAWKSKALLMQRIDCGVRIPSSPGADLHPLSHHSIQVAAGVRSVPAPSWVRHLENEGIDIRFKSLDLNQPWGKAIKRGIVGDVPKTIAKLEREKVPEPSSTDSTESIHQLLSAHRYRTALRRVSSVFLSRHSQLHPDCLNVPHQMYGNRILWNESPEDLLHCCPVALGFWMWRIASSDTYRGFVSTMQDIYFKRARDANIDLLLYAMARSHLHYCICLAKNSIDKAFAPGSCTLGEAIEPVERVMAGGRWSPIFCRKPPAREHHIDIAGKCYFVHFDSSELIRKIPCAGSKILSERLFRLNTPMRQARAANPLPGPKDWDPSEMQEMPDTPQPAFTPTNNDYLFMPEVDDQTVHDMYAKGFWILEYQKPKRKMPSLGQYGVLNSSINSKLKLEPPKRGIRSRRPRT